MPTGFTIDIGGEGRHPAAWNVNPSRVRTFGARRGEPIPRLICARGDALPLADRSVACVIVERTPLRHGLLAEIARVLAPGGRVELRHVPLPDEDRHRAAIDLLGGQIARGLSRIGSQAVQETIILAPRA